MMHIRLQAPFVQLGCHVLLRRLQQRLVLVVLLQFDYSFVSVWHAGIFCDYVFVYYYDDIGAVIIALIPPNIRPNELELFPRVVSLIADSICRYTKRWAVIPIIVVVLMMQSLWYLSTETSFISVFFKPDNVVRQQVDFVDNHLLGSGRLDVILPADRSDRFKEVEYYNQLSQYVDVALMHPYIEGANGLTVPVKMIHSSFQNTGSDSPQTDEELEQEILFLEFSRGESKTDVLSSVIDFNYEHSRIEFILDQLPTSKINELVAHLTTLLVIGRWENLLLLGLSFYRMCWDIMFYNLSLLL